MPLTNKALEEWKAKAVPGTCPGTDCGLPLPPPKPGTGRGRGGKRDICGAAKCRKEYLTVYQKGRSATALRTFTATPVDGKRGRVRVLFEPCGHTEEAPRSVVENGNRRRRCPSCAAGAPPIIASADAHS